MEDQNLSLTRAQRSELNRALDQVRQFIRLLNFVEEPPISFGTMFFSIDPYGGIYLNGDDLRNYRACLETLVQAVNSIKPASKRAVEKLFEKAILFSVNGDEQSKDISRKKRLSNAIQELEKSIVTRPNKFIIYHPVSGLAKDSLPITIGEITFDIFDSYSERMEEIYSRPDNIENKAARLDYMNRIREGLQGKVIGITEITAADPESAITLAVKGLRVTIDVINFYSDLIPYSHGYAFLPGDIEETSICILVSDTQFLPRFLSRHSVGPIAELSFPRLMEINDKKSLGLFTISDILKKERNELEDRILSSMQWSGRATIETRNEEAFLLYAIALESLILPEGETEESIMSRLKKRVAHLLSEDSEERKRISRLVGNLYDIRSKIVHDGLYQVTDIDRDLLRRITKVCISHILTTSTFTSMTIEQFIQWFEA